MKSIELQATLAHFARTETATTNTITFDLLSQGDDDVFYAVSNERIDKASPSAFKKMDSKIHLKVPGLSAKTTLTSVPSWLTVASSADLEQNSNKSTKLEPGKQLEPEENPFCELYRNFYENSGDNGVLSQNRSEHLMTIVPTVKVFSAGRNNSFHLCSPLDDEPFYGVLTFRASTLSCCPLTSFMLLLPDHPAYKTAFTPFGKRLLQICHRQGHDLRFEIGDELFTSWWRNSPSWGKVRDLKAFLHRAVDPYVDEDGVLWQFDECSVCFASCRFVRRPGCCQNAICQLCWQEYVRNEASANFQVYQTGAYNLRCFACLEIVSYNEALVSLDPDDIALIRPPFQLINSGSRCPVCLQPPPPLFNSEEKLQKLRKKKGGYQVTCERCQNIFCGLCSCRVHPTISCQKLLETDQGFRKWMKQRNPDSPEFPNGRRCPSCSIAIAREGGCPTITCKCGTNFCFSCGRRKLTFPLGHTSNRNLPFISCPKLWRSKTKRRIVHSLVIVGICPIVIVLSPIALPIGIIACIIMKAKRNKRRQLRQ